MPRPSPVPSRVSVRSRAARSSIPYPAVTLPFTDTFTRADGPLGSPWVDLYSYHPLLFDPMGVRSNSATDVLHIDDNFGGSTVTTGWRAGAFIDAGITNDISVTTIQASGADEAAVSGGPIACIKLGDSGLALGAWWNPAFNYIELGTLALATADFQYLDTNWCEDFAGAPEIELRIVDNIASVFVNSNLYCRAPVPAALQGSSLVGITTDDLDGSSAETTNIESVVVAEDGTQSTDYDSPSFPSASYLGTATKASGASTINVPYPAAVDAGQELFLFVGNSSNRTISTPAGWDAIQNDGFGVILGVFHKTATGSESGSETVTFSGTASSGGVIVAVSDVSAVKPYNGYQGNLASGTSITVPADNVLGRKRLGLMFSFASVDTTHTHPAAWTPLAVSSAGGAAVSFKVSAATISIDDPGLADDQHWREWPEETITTGASGNIIAMRVQVFPQTF